MSPKDAVAFVKRHGVVLQAARGPVPSLAEAIAGGPIRGSWWGHAKGRAIFQAAQAVCDSDEVLVCKLVDGKVTYVHRRMWPALVKLAPRFRKAQLARVWDEHTESGAHMSKQIPFPVWVPSDVVKESEALPMAEAEKVLSVLLAKSSAKKRSALLAVGLLVSGAAIGLAQGQQPPDQPAVAVRGQTYTPRSILSRNMGTEEDQTTAFRPHKVIGNIYYVGTRTLSSFLITTPEGHILINSTYERNVRTIEKSVTQLGFKLSDVRVLLGTHAHGDHQEGDALVKELTGAQVMVMQEDVPALEAIKPGGKAHPIDRMLRDGDEVKLGGTTLVAHLTAGHTRGCTTWTMRAQEGGKSFNVVFACSYRAPGNVTPAIESEFNRTFKVLRSLPCDVPLGDHPAQYNLAAKYARVKAGAPNPFIDSANCWIEAEIQEAMLRAQIQMQQNAARE